MEKDSADWNFSLECAKTNSKHVDKLKYVGVDFGPCIYYLFNQAGEVVYIGHSKNPKQRLRQHLILKRIHFTHFTLFPCQKARMTTLEANAIFLHKPIHNFFGNPDHWDEIYEMKRKGGVTAQQLRNQARLLSH